MDETQHMLLHKLLIIALVLPGLLFPLPLWAAESRKEARIPEALNPALEHLLALTKPGSTVQFDPRTIDKLLDFVTEAKDPSIAYHAGKWEDCPSVYHEFNIERPLEDILDLAYNPDIPAQFTIPSSVRLSHYTDTRGNRSPPPRLSDSLTGLTTPVIFKLGEFLENTPDTHSGAYYSYMLSRTMILMKHRGNTLLLSMSYQDAPSDVGKIGLVLGPDDEWNYIYTGKPGTTKTGLGWVESYMYNSASVMIYYETAGPAPTVRCGVFKWLRAGWAGINLVQSKHIRTGVERFTTVYKEIIESPRMPDLPDLKQTIASIDNLSTEDLRAKSRSYFEYLKARYQGENSHSRKWFSEEFKKGQFLDKMTREELQALLCVEYLKYILGKNHQFDVTHFLSPSPPKSAG